MDLGVVVNWKKDFSLMSLDYLQGRRHSGIDLSLPDFDRGFGGEMYLFIDGPVLL